MQSESSQLRELELLLSSHRVSNLAKVKAIAKLLHFLKKLQ